MESRAEIAAGKRHYGWAIFGLSFTNLFVEGGIKNTVPVVYVALRDSFKWSATTTSSIFSVAGVAGVEDVQSLGDANGTSRLRAVPAGGAAIAEDIGEMLRGKNTPVREMYVERGALYDVFRKITAPEDFADA